MRTQDRKSYDRQASSYVFHEMEYTFFIHNAFVIMTLFTMFTRYTLQCVCLWQCLRNPICMENKFKGF